MDSLSRTRWRLTAGRKLLRHRRLRRARATPPPAALPNVGAIFAGSPAALATGTMLTPLDVTDVGGYASGIRGWIGSPSPDAPGSRDTTCADWTLNDGSVSGRLARSLNTLSGLFGQADVPCAALGPIYCLEP